MAVSFCIHPLLHVIWTWSIENWGLTHANAPWQLWALQMLLLSVRTGILYFCRGQFVPKKWWNGCFHAFSCMFLVSFLLANPIIYEVQRRAACTVLMWLQRTRVTPGPTMPLNPWLRLIPIESWVEFEININLKWELMDGPVDGCIRQLMIFDDVWCFFTE